MSSRRLGRDLVWLCAAVALLAGCVDSGNLRRSLTAVGDSAPAQCTHRLGRQLLVAADDGGAPLHLVTGRALWLRFTGGGNGWRWTRPASTDPTVAGFRFVVRCPGGVVVAEVHALAPGSTELHATLASSLPGLPAFGWDVPLGVPAHKQRTPPAPASSRLIGGGGVLVWPKRLYSGGADTEFSVPAVTCPPGTRSRVRVGLFGVRRFIPASGPSRVAPWWAGLVITCAATGQAGYSIGYANRPTVDHVQPGDEVDVSISGGDCPSVTIDVSAPHSRVGRGYTGPGCAAENDDQVRVRIQPTVLFGANVDGPGPHPVGLTLRSLTINGQPFWMAPHLLRKQVRHGTPAVKVHPTRDWYRSQLTIT